MDKVLSMLLYTSHFALSIRHIEHNMNISVENSTEIEKKIAIQKTQRMCLYRYRSFLNYILRFDFPSNSASRAIEIRVQAFFSRRRVPILRENRNFGRKVIWMDDCCF